MPCTRPEKNLKRFIAAAFALIFIQSAPTTAQEAPLEDYFFSFATCYGRSYSVEHLKRHPNQNVVEIAISHFPHAQELLGLESPWQPYPETPNIALKLDVLMKDEEKIWQTDAICSQANDRLRCQLECDAGHFFLQSHKNESLLITDGSDLHFNSCDTGSRILKREPDDKSFRLNPIPLSHCALRTNDMQSIYQPR